MAVVALLNVIVPQLEVVGQMKAVSMSPPETAPSVISMKRVGENFQEFKSNSSAMVVLESDHQLDDAAHKFYDEMIKKLEADTKHVEHIQDMWGRSADGGRCAERRRQGHLRAGVHGR